MAYISDNLALKYNSVGGALPREWAYLNATPDANAAIVAAGYVSDGIVKGLRVGDLVDAINVGTARHTRYQVTAVTATAATLSAVTAIA